jgi:nitroreductase
MTLSDPDLAALVATANLAPSVHNTQPTRWRRDTEGRVLVFEDVCRLLPVGDPLGRDAAVSHGAAIEGFAMACAAIGRSVGVDLLTGPASAGLRPVARITLADGAPPDRLAALVPRRRTYRGRFAQPDAAPPLNALDGLAAAGDVRLVRDPRGVERLARLNDEASLRTFRDGPYRAELLSWMRLSPGHPGWARDGLNAEAMAMSRFEAAGAGLVLKPDVFEALDRLGAASLFVAEARVVRSAQAIILFHRPDTEHPLITGRRFYRLWLEAAALGLSAAPMAVLADDEQVRAIIAQDFGLPPGRRLITAFRLGRAPPAPKGPKPRLPVEALMC